MIKRKPFCFMKRKGKGFIRVRKTRGKDPIIKQSWSDASIVVFENRDEFPRVPGNYKFDTEKKAMIGPRTNDKYDVKTSVIVPVGKKFPKFSQVVPKRNGYKEAKPLLKNGHLCLGRIDNYVSYQTMVVELQSGDIKTLLDLEYYDYLEQNYGTSPCAGEWQIKGQDEPVLFLWDGEIKAVVMPIKGYDKEQEGE